MRLIKFSAMTGFACLAFLASVHAYGFESPTSQNPTSQNPDSENAVSENPAQETDELDTRLNSELSERIRPLLSKYCGDCHMGDANEAGVNIEDYKTIEQIRAHASSWSQIRGVIRADAMPPPDVAVLEAEEKNLLVDWIESALTEIDCSCEVETPVVTLRRLNQVEYDNTVRTLLLLPEVKPSKDFGFVSDDVGNGFDNQGEVLTLPPIVMEKYLQSAEYLAKNAISIDRESMRKQRFDGIRLSYGTTHSVPVYLAEGNHELIVRMRFGDGQPDKANAILRVNGEKIREWQVSTRGTNFVVNVELQDGDNQIDVLYDSDDDPSKSGSDARRLIVEWLETKGPTDRQPRFLPPHEAIVVAYPEDKDPGENDSAEGTAIGYEEACRRVFTPFLKRAYRRPPTEEDITRILNVCNHAKEAGFSYLESIRYGVQATLVSPNFLFRTESFAGTGPLDAHALATRLSYFLWSDMPDSVLMGLADSGELMQETILKEQVSRMLQDEKSKALIHGFFSQWLGLRNLAKIDIDKDKYPLWNDRLRDAMMRETEMFCQYLITEGTASDITSAKFTFVNPRLAEFYGVKYGESEPADLYQGRQGRGGNASRQGLYQHENEWLKVELPEQRLGLLTQPAVLALTSNPARTSPVKRGKWVLESILGDPPPSAPPNVPSLESESHGEDVSLRERLEIHRSNPSCAGCHKILDPIGLGLENFDAIGRWREEENGRKLEVQGEFTDGSTFETPRQLVELLSKKQDQVLLNLTQRMMTYALGRGLQREDRCAIDQVIGYSESQNGSVRSIIEAIVLSDTFQQSPFIAPVPAE